MVKLVSKSPFFAIFIFFYRFIIARLFTRRILLKLVPEVEDVDSYGDLLIGGSQPVWVSTFSRLTLVLWPNFLLLLVFGLYGSSCTGTGMSMNTRSLLVSDALF